MKNKIKVGLNRTGIALSPRMGPEMVRAAEMYSPDPVGGLTIEAVRASYAAEALPIGTLPPPSSLKEASLQALQMLKGNKAPVYIDKLGARLAFERSGARLYEALLPRLEAGPTWEGGPARDDILEIHADEVQHFQLLRNCIEQLGGDPTVQTPAADVSAVSSLGLMQTLGDSRMSLLQALHCILIAELVDNDGWATLIELSSVVGQDEHTRHFMAAQAAEERHLVRVRGWVRSALLADAGMDLDEEFADGNGRDRYGETPLH